jgi:hypothetical protein
MAKYLDQTGLKYFWGKIKDKMPGPLQAYPVGSVYISISYNFNPNTSFGGTWERFGQGRTLIGEGTGDDGSTSMSFTAGSTGGEYKHKLTVDEIPSHSHKYYSPVVQRVATSSSGSTYGNYNKDYLIRTDYVGGDGYHNNVQPYVTVYFWKRTA